MTRVCLLAFLIAALSITLANRRIGIKHGEWWAIYLIVFCVYMVGRFL